LAVGGALLLTLPSFAVSPSAGASVGAQIREGLA
jgi:hypothetical protein